MRLSVQSLKNQISSSPILSYDSESHNKAQEGGIQYIYLCFQHVHLVLFSHEDLPNYLDGSTAFYSYDI